MDVPSRSIRVEGKIYSAEAMAQFHPGGPLFIKAFAGRDASMAFLSYHRKKFPHQKVQDCLEGEDTTVEKWQPCEDFLELVRRVDKVLPRHRAFAPWSYYLKAITILVISFSLEAYIHYTGSYQWYLTAILGFFFALIGLNIQHDANHGALSKKSYVNRIFGASQNYIGGSAVGWIHQHVIQHHIHTNDVHLDPDIEGMLIYRLNPLQPLLKIHFFQYVYYFLLLTLFGISHVSWTLMNLIKGFHFTAMSEMLGFYRFIEAVFSLIFFARWFVYPLWAYPSLSTFAAVWTLLAVEGYYLAFFFVLSHNFQGVHMLHETKPDKTNKTFLYNQVVSSSNVAGSWLCFLNGGLNYQIEHHLFPRINHCHYPTIAPVVREFCEEKKIPYVHFSSVGANLTSCVKHLYELGSQKVPVSMTWVN